MTLSEFGLLAFTTCNTLRIFAYVPQLIRILGDREGARAISFATWGLFALSNFSTALYGLATVNDVAVTAVFGANALFCLAIVGATAWKRTRAKGFDSQVVVRSLENLQTRKVEPAPPSAKWRRRAT